MKRLAILAVALMTAFTAITPAQAFPVAAAPTIQNSDVVNVQYSEYRRHGRNHGGRGRYYDNGRRYDRGYRRHNNTGAIIGGLAAGAIIGGIVAGSRSSGGSSCASRYRSYRASDNTYQPNSGPRVQCR